MKLATGENIIGNVWVHPTSKVDPTAVLGPNVMIGENCSVGPGARIFDSCVLSNTEVVGFSYIQGSIVGWRNKIGKWVRIQGVSVTAEDVQVKDEVFLNQTMVLPHKGVASSFPNSGAIVM